MSKKMDILQNKKILITGVSGYLGSHLLEELLKHDIHTIRGISRNESKLSELKEKVNDDRACLYVGDIRDINRMQEVVDGVDIIYHCAAMKHTDFVQRNLFEAIQTNIIGTQNLINLSREYDIKQFISIDTDKSCGGTLNAYGTTKKLMREQTITANYIRDLHKTKYSVFRWGNILNSSGSVVPKWIDSIKRNNIIQITNPIMTRFNLSIEEVINFMLNCQENMIGGEIFIPEMKSYCLRVLSEAIIEKYGDNNTQIRYIQNRGSEKTDEDLLDINEFERFYKVKNGYVVIPEEKYREEFGIIYKYQQLSPTDILYSLKRYTSKDMLNLSKQELKAMI